MNSLKTKLKNSYIGSPYCENFFVCIQFDWQ